MNHYCEMFWVLAGNPTEKCFSNMLFERLFFFPCANTAKQNVGPSHTMLRACSAVSHFLGGTMQQVQQCQTNTSNLQSKTLKV